MLKTLKDLREKLIKSAEQLDDDAAIRKTASSRKLDATHVLNFIKFFARR